MSIHKQHTLWNDFHPVRIIVGKTGVLRLIADYVGILRGKERKILHSLVQVLREDIRI